METKEELIFHISGKNYIEVQDLRNLLDGAIESMAGITESSLDDGVYRNFVVEAPEKGSFKLIFGLIVSGATLALKYHEEIKSYVEIFIELVKLKKGLDGKPPKKVEEKSGNVVVTLGDNSQININKLVFDEYSSNSSIDEGLTKLIDTISSQDEELTISDNSERENKVSITPSEAKRINKPVLLNNEEKIETEIFDESLIVEKPDFSGRTMWSVYSRGERKNVSIEDDSFLDSVRQNQIKFGSNTIIHCRIRLEVFFGLNGKPKGKPKYYIEKVHSVIDETHDQQKLDI